MRKWMLLLVAIMLLTACSHKDVSKKDSHPAKATNNSTQNGSESSEQQKSAKTTTDHKDATNSNVSKPGSEQPKNVLASEGLSGYRPNVGIKKTFVATGQIEITYDITAENPKYVQRIVHLGKMTTLQILNWSKSQVSIVYEEQNPNSTANQLDSFKTTEPPQLLLDLQKKGSGNDSNWQVIATDKTVDVPNGEFKNVIEVRKTDKADNGVKNIQTDFYAPKMGLIKEIHDVSGKNGYHAEINLTKISN